uniref:Putative ovule protein n=1 Tax=Solanum chacoense TaxID=4108 RepID=A0A0V0HK98_SOLCH
MMIVWNKLPVGCPFFSILVLLLLLFYYIILQFLLLHIVSFVSIIVLLFCCCYCSFLHYFRHEFFTTVSPFQTCFEMLYLSRGSFGNNHSTFTRQG